MSHFDWTNVPINNDWLTFMWYNWVKSSKQDMHRIVKAEAPAAANQTIRTIYQLRRSIHLCNRLVCHCTIMSRAHGCDYSKRWLAPICGWYYECVHVHMWWPIIVTHIIIAAIISNHWQFTFYGRNFWSNLQIDRAHNARVSDVVKVTDFDHHLFNDLIILTLIRTKWRNRHLI